MMIHVADEWQPQLHRIVGTGESNTQGSFRAQNRRDGECEYLVGRLTSAWRMMIGYCLDLAELGKAARAALR
jgi:hypothetical protein